MTYKHVGLTLILGLEIGQGVCLRVCPPIVTRVNWNVEDTKRLACEERGQPRN